MAAATTPDGTLAFSPTSNVDRVLQSTAVGRPGRGWRDVVHPPPAVARWPGWLRRSLFASASDRGLDLQHNKQMTRRATSVHLDADLMAAVEAVASRTNTAPDEVIEGAVRGRFAAEDALRRAWSRIRERELADDAAIELAYSELRAMRAERRGEAAR